MARSPKIGVSSCLLGERVRYDGGHKHDRWLTDILGPFVTFVPVCPEVGAGLPVPREAMRLEGEPTAPRLVTTRSRVDLTERMLAFCRAKVVELEREELCGFVFKKDSPSSGLFRVKIYNGGGVARSGSGLFARAVAEHFPNLPVEEEGRLNDPLLRENFLERVFAYCRWQEFCREDGGMGGLVRFHTCHKLQLMAHNPRLYRELGKLVASGKGVGRDELLRSYETLFMRTLGYRATPGKQTDLLMHMMGYFKQQLSTDEKSELLELFGQYRQGQVSLPIPLTLLRHYVRTFGQPYLEQQTWFDTHPFYLLRS